MKGPQAMSTPKSPKTPPPLFDPHEVQERFADDIAGVQVRGDGTWHFTFTVSRPNHQMPGMTHNDPDRKRIVVDRLILPEPLALRLATIIGQVKSASEQHVALAEVKKN
jgi:hypothetical protein